MLGVTFSTLIIGLTMSFMDSAYTKTVPAASLSIDYTFADTDVAGLTPMTETAVKALRTKTADERSAIDAFAATGQGLVSKSIIGSKDLPDGLYLLGATDHKVHFIVQRGIGTRLCPRRRVS